MDEKITDEERLNDLLRRRALPPPRSNLSARIIAAAQAETTVKTPLTQRLLRAFQDSFMVPQPAFALALFLLIGLAAGLAVDVPGAAADDTDAQDWAAYLYVDDDPAYGDWL